MDPGGTSRKEVTGRERLWEVKVVKEETTMHYAEPFTEVRVERKRKKHGVFHHIVTYLKPRNRTQ